MGGHGGCGERGGVRWAGAGAGEDQGWVRVGGVEGGEEPVVDGGGSQEVWKPGSLECCGEGRAGGARVGILGFLDSRILGFWRLRAPQGELPASVLEGDFGGCGDVPAILGDGDGFGILVAEVDVDGGGGAGGADADESAASATVGAGAERGAS